jgi:hypothetical protein
MGNPTIPMTHGYLLMSVTLYQTYLSPGNENPVSVGDLALDRVSKRIAKVKWSKNNGPQ